MRFESTEIAGVVLVHPNVFSDERGHFFESWEARKFAAAGIDARFVQDNQSYSLRHTLRGLHYQILQPQGKLVRVIAGAVFDVAIDLRRSSMTFGKSIGVELSAENRRMLWVPPGFAHGFLVLSESAVFHYKCTDFYSPAGERSIRWNDSDLRINWPLPPDSAPILSSKDAQAPSFHDSECYP
jgi:dTDP-4-dehydrorhamnose 3,5-epimerase